MKEYFVGTDDFLRAHELTVTEDGIHQGAMISANALRHRKSPINPGRWMLDSGAFSQVTQYGDFTMSPKEYVELAVRFQDCGDLACIVTQDYMCEPQVIAHLKSIGIQASWRLHQRKSVDRYEQILVEGDRQGLKVPVMPVLQGWEVEDYMEHWSLYCNVNRELDRRAPNFEGYIYLAHGYTHDHPQWLGLGSTCKRNAKPQVVGQILDTMPWHYINGQEDFRIHAFGLKKTALKHGSIKDRLYSADSFAYDFHARISGQIRTRRARMDSATRWGKEVRKNQVQMHIEI